MEPTVRVRPWYGKRKVNGTILSYRVVPFLFPCPAASLSAVSNIRIPSVLADTSNGNVI